MSDKDSKRIFLPAAVSCFPTAALFMIYAVFGIVWIAQTASAPQNTASDCIIVVLIAFFLKPGLYFLEFGIFAIGALFAAAFITIGVKLILGRNKLCSMLACAILVFIMSVFTFPIYLGRMIVHGPIQLTEFILLGLLPFAFSILNITLNRIANHKIKSRIIPNSFC